MTVTASDTESIDAQLAIAVFSALKARDLAAILIDICRRRGVMTYEVCGRARTKNVCFARHELWWRIRNLHDRYYSSNEIAALFHCDHSTILGGIKAHQKRMKP